MDLRTALRLTAGVALMAGCAAPTEPRLLPVASHHGDWSVAPIALGPTERLSRSLALRADGTFTAQSLLFGTYEGQRPTDLSAVHTIEGTYSVDGDRAHFRARRLIIWDLASGAKSKPRTQEYSGSIFDDARFTLDGDLLTLTYTTYTADAPVETTTLYVRTYYAAFAGIGSS